MVSKHSILRMARQPSHTANDLKSFVIFPQWSDAAVNAEKWEEDKSKTTVQGPRRGVFPKRLASVMSAVAEAEESMLLLEDQWDDPQSVLLPDKIANRIVAWKRPEEIFRNVQLILTTNTLKPYELLIGSSHLLHSEFMRDFLSSLNLLNHISKTNAWKIEAVNSGYVPNTEGLSWKPWHHIYGMCKAGKGQTHAPKYTPSGKYIVRLFWMGFWRMVYVDDTIPIDESGITLLPGYTYVPPMSTKHSSISGAMRSINTSWDSRNKAKLKSEGHTSDKSLARSKSKSSKGSKKSLKKDITPSSKALSKIAIENHQPPPEFEIWPTVLCKALLKIASLSWTKENELLDYSAIQCLTGWIPQKLDTSGMTGEEIWNICMHYSPSYTVDDSKEQKSNEMESKDGKKLKKNKSSNASKKSKSSKGSKKSKKAQIKKADEPTSMEEEDITSIYCIIGTCAGAKALLQNHCMDNIVDDWPHDILIERTRDIPLDNPPERASLPRWKRFRWLKWAISSGIWSYEDTELPIRYMKLVGQVDTELKIEDITTKGKLGSKMDDKESTSGNPVSRIKSARSDEEKKGKIKKKEKKSDKKEGNSDKKKGKSDKKEGKSDKKEGKSDKKERKSDKKERKSDKNDKGTKGAGLKVVPSLNGLQEGIWVDFDEIRPKLTALTVLFRPSSFKSVVRISEIFPNVNYQNKLAKPTKDKAKKEEQSVRIDTAMPRNKYRNISPLLILNSFSPKILIINLTSCGRVKNVDPNFELLDHENVPFTYATASDFIWHTNYLGPHKALLRTLGSKSCLLLFAPGKNIIRMFFNSNCGYLVTILSNCSLAYGTPSEIAEEYGRESYLLLNTAQHFSTAFGKLVNSYGTPDYVKYSREFHKSYVGNLPLTKLEKRSLYEHMTNILTTMIGDKRQVFALKVLFLDPNLQKESINKIGNDRITSIIHLYAADDSMIDGSMTSIDIEKYLQMSALKLQSNFRKLACKRLYDLHKTTTEGYTDIYDRLKKIYNDYFSVAKRQNCVAIIRELFLENEILQISDLYWDLLKTVSFKTFKGSVESQPWMLFTRQRFCVTCDGVVKVQYCVTSNTTAAILRIINNDTLEEIKEGVDMAVSRYTRNENGYTFLYYGRLDEPLPVQDTWWSLTFVHLRTARQSIAVGEEQTATTSLSRVYEPNVNNIVAECVLEVRQHTHATIRLATTGKYAVIELMVMTENRKVLGKVSGIQNVMIPLVMVGKGLRSLSSVLYDKKSRSSLIGKLKPSSTKQQSSHKIADETKRYYIVATVAQNTWPLTASEWLNVKLQKRKHLLYPPEGTDSNRSKEDEVTSPKWTLHVIHGPRDYVKLMEDTTRREEINDIKRGWYENDPDRRTKSIAIREEYLKDICATAASCCDSSKEMECGVPSEHSIDSDVFLHRWIPEMVMMPKFLLCDYYKTSFEENPKWAPQTPDWEQYLEEAANEQILATCESLLKAQWTMEHTLQQQVQSFNRIHTWYDGLRSDSVSMMKSAYGERQKFIDMMLAVPKVVEGLPKRKKSTSPKGKGKKKK